MNVRKLFTICKRYIPVNNMNRQLACLISKPRYMNYKPVNNLYGVVTVLEVLVSSSSLFSWKLQTSIHVRFLMKQIFELILEVR